MSASDQAATAGLLSTISYLRVLNQGRLVGTLAETNEGLMAFQYDSKWLTEGYSISPRSLPLEPRVFVPREQPFDGVWGIFN